MQDNEAVATSNEFSGKPNCSVEYVGTVIVGRRRSVVSSLVRSRIRLVDLLAVLIPLGDGTQLVHDLRKK